MEEHIIFYDRFLRWNFRTHDQDNVEASQITGAEKPLSFALDVYIHWQDSVIFQGTGYVARWVIFLVMLCIFLYIISSFSHQVGWGVEQEQKGEGSKVIFLEPRRRDKIWPEKVNNIYQWSTLWMMWCLIYGECEAVCQAQKREE